MSDNPQDLRQVVFAFLANLPITIREHVLLFVIIYAIRIIPSLDLNYSDSVRDYLLDANDIRSFGALLSTIAVIDHVLADRVANAERRAATVEAFAEQFPDAQDQALKVPLQSRHFEQALADWNKLRASLLTAQMIRGFEDILMGIRPKR